MFRSFNISIHSTFVPTDRYTFHIEEDALNRQRATLDTFTAATTQHIIEATFVSFQFRSFAPSLLNFPCSDTLRNFTATCLLGFAAMCYTILRYFLFTIATSSPANPILYSNSVQRCQVCF
jgi:hypothetical protein